MKKQLLIVAGLLVSVFYGFSQDWPCPMGGSGMKGREGKGMMHELALTEAQKTKMKEIRKDYRSKMDALEKTEKISLKDYRSGQAALQQDMKSKMESLLTADQKNKLIESKNKRRAEGEARMQKKLEMAKVNLSLTDEQYGRMKAAQDKMKAGISAIRENNALSFEQKKQQIRTLRESEMEGIRSILNADQIMQMEEMKGRMRQHRDGNRMRQGPAAR